MINMKELFQLAEADLKSNRVLGSDTCGKFGELSSAEQAAFKGLITFLGCQLNIISDEPAIPQEMERVYASRLMLIKMYVDTGDPRWSSWILDQFIEIVLKIPGAKLDDLYKALFQLMGEESCELTDSSANFLKDVTVRCFTAHPESYNSSDFRWMVRAGETGLTPSQAFLCLHILPPAELSPKVVLEILRGMRQTPYWEVALNELEEELQQNKTKQLLSKWLAEENEIDSDQREQLHQVLHRG